MQSTDTATTRVRHACAVPVSDEQLWEMSADYVAEGLRAGARVVYFADESADQVLDRLDDDGVSVHEPLDDGRLLVVPTDATREVLSGSVAGLEGTLLAVVDDSLRQGYPAVRVTGQMVHALRREGGVGVADYEAGLSRVLTRRPAMGALCLYAQHRFPAEVIRELRAVHEYEVGSAAAYDDGLLRITRPGIGRLRLAGEADHSNRGVLDRLLDSVLDETLRAPAGPTTVAVDLASLRFLDVAGAMSLIAAADRFPITHRLALRGARPRVQRVLERCGALFAPQVDLAARADVPAQRTPSPAERPARHSAEQDARRDAEQAPEQGAEHDELAVHRS